MAERRNGFAEVTSIWASIENVEGSGWPVNLLL